MSDLVVWRNCCMARMLLEKPSWCRNEQVCQGGQTSVKRFERFNRLDTALYKNYLYLVFFLTRASRLLFGVSVSHCFSGDVAAYGYYVFSPIGVFLFFSAFIVPLLLMSFASTPSVQ